MPESIVSVLVFLVSILAVALSITLIFAQLKLFSIDRTLKEILAAIAEAPRSAPEPYSPEAFAAARKRGNTNG